MKYIVGVLTFISIHAFADELRKSESQGFCAYENRAYSLGFVLVLEDGKKYFRCTKILNPDATKGFAWVEIQEKKNSETYYKLKK